MEGGIILNYPMVSLIIPMYNAEKFIKKCLDSVINQTYQNYEIIIVNDGSTDHSKEIVEEIKKENNNIILVNQKNQGSTIARKTGLENMSLESAFFCFCDADDFIAQGYINEMVEAAIKNNADIIQSGYVKCIGRYKYNDYIPECLQQKQIYNKDEIMNKLYLSFFGITNFPGYLNTKLYKRKFKDIIINLPTVVSFMADDLSVNIRLLPLCDVIVTIPDKLYFYQAGGGTSKYMPNFMNDYFHYHQLQLSMISQYLLSDKYLYYSQIEIINVLKTWLMMELMYKKVNYNSFSDEVNKWLDILEIKNAVENISENRDWNSPFFEYLTRDNLNELYKYLKKESKKIKLKRKIKLLLEKVL